MNIIILVFLGALIGMFNSLAIKWTIKKVLKYKNPGIAVLSFFIRMVIICLLFYFFMNSNWKNAVFILFGLTISKIFFIILEKKNSVKK